MSDDSDEYEYEYDDSDQDDDGGGGGDDDEPFQYSDDEDPNDAEEGEVALENAYYNAKGQRDNGDFDEAAETFEGVVTMEVAMKKKQAGVEDDGDDAAMTDANDCQHHGLWGYKAIKQLVKLHLRSVNGAAALRDYERMLRVSSSRGAAISPNAVEKGVNGMLERVSSIVNGSNEAFVPDVAGEGEDFGGGAGSSVGENPNDPRVLARNVYDATLRNFHPREGISPNERLWFKTNLKYGQLLYEMNETPKLQAVIRDLLKSSGQSVDFLESGSGGVGAGGGGSMASDGGGGGGTHVMEIAALQIQLYSRLKDTKKLRVVFQRAMSVRGGIPHPRTLALIQELGGKMHMSQRNFDEASQSFFQAFKSYDEAGDRARLRCLKYLVMASMLHASSINPFDSHEARAHRDDPEIVAMTNLVAAFHDDDVRRFEKILRGNEGRIMDDEFVREHVADLLRTIRTQVLMRTIGPYTRIRLARIAKELNGIPVEDVEGLLVSLILDGRLRGRIDQVRGIFIVEKKLLGNDDENGAEGSEAVSSSGDTADSSGGGAGKAAPLEAVSVEARSIEAMDRLTAALELLTSAVTNVGSKASFHQQVLH